MVEPRQADRSATARLAPPSYCAKCGRGLAGRPAPGECPECGFAYERWTVATRRPPSTIGALIAFGWPIAFFAIGTYIVNAPGSGISDLSGLVMTFSVLALLINLPVQLVRQNRMRAAGVPRSAVATAVSIILVVISLVLLVPFVLLGACLLEMAASGH